MTTNGIRQPSSSDTEPLVLQDLERFLSYRHDGSRSTNSDEPNDDYTNTNNIYETSRGVDTTVCPSLLNNSAMAVPVAAMKALLGVVERTEAETMMQLQDELREASEQMMSRFSKSYGIVRVALESGCELFLKYITRTFLELDDFEACKQAILERGQRFQTISLAARDRIATLAAAFVPQNGTVLTHGYSRVVANILLNAASNNNKNNNKHFDLIVLEGRPDAAGVKAAQIYAQQGIPVRVCLDAAMGTIMEQVDVVLTGAEAIAENGGVINKVGTYALACCAAANNKPMYVAVESYKFARLYPLKQSDLPLGERSKESSPSIQFCDTSSSSVTKTSLTPIEVDAAIEVYDPPVDLTPAKFITLLFTDLGVLTPSAVSDELIRLYQ